MPIFRRYPPEWSETKVKVDDKLVVPRMGYKPRIFYPPCVLHIRFDKANQTGQEPAKQPVEAGPDAPGGWLSVGLILVLMLFAASAYAGISTAIVSLIERRVPGGSFSSYEQDDRYKPQCRLALWVGLLIGWPVFLTFWSAKKLVTCAADFLTSEG